MPPGIATPGEPLHCVDHVGKPVDEVTAMLRERGVTVSYTAHGEPSGFTPPGDWYVHDGVMSADGQALLPAGAEPGPLSGPAPEPGC
ncbi:hypothetical protein [Streptosporangium longisporum]|uniref:PASTA domain-containing protein n=1 Tax=Streptosporangium longisporum TaxID=46187 RepID=A0ABP6LGM2_9ACTN